MDMDDAKLLMEGKQLQKNVLFVGTHNRFILSDKSAHNQPIMTICCESRGLTGSPTYKPNLQTSADTAVVYLVIATAFHECQDQTHYCTLTSVVPLGPHEAGIPKGTVWRSLHKVGESRVFLNIIFDCHLILNL